MAFAYVWPLAIMQPEADTRVIPPRNGRAEEAMPEQALPVEAMDAASPAEPMPAGPVLVEPVFLQRWVGRYELIHRLAHGGMGTVYLGRAKGKAGFEKV